MADTATATQPAVVATGSPSVSTGTQPATPAASPNGASATAAPWGDKYKSADEVWSSYQSLEEKLGKQGEELGRYRTGYEDINGRLSKWEQWWQTQMAPHWSDVEQFLRTGGRPAQPQPQQQTQAQMAQQQQNWLQDWETLSPTDQARRLQEYSASQIVNALSPVLTNWQQSVVNDNQQKIAALEAALQQEKQYYDNYLTLMRHVIDMRFQDPNANIDDVLNRSVELMQQQKDPKKLLELGKQLATSKITTEKQIKDAIEQARKDWEQEVKNKDLAAVTPTNGMPPAFKPKIGATPGGVASQREGVAKALIEKFGPGIFGGGR